VGIQVQQFFIECKLQRSLDEDLHAVVGASASRCRRVRVQVAGGRVGMLHVHWLAPFQVLQQDSAGTRLVGVL